MDVKTRERDDIIIFDIRGEIKRSDITGVTLRQLVKEQLDRGKRRILLNFQDVEFIDSFAGEDIYINVAGGMSIEEPAADLGVVLAVVSSLKNKAIPKGMGVFGER